MALASEYIWGLWSQVGANSRIADCGNDTSVGPVWAVTKYLGDHDELPKYGGENQGGQCRLFVPRVQMIAWIVGSVIHPSMLR